MTNNIIVIGAGRLGSTIARSLHNESNVLVIDKNKEKANRLQDYSGFIEVGDATDLSFLEKNGIESCEKVIIVTDDDNINIFISDLCQYVYGVPVVYAKLKDSRKRKLVDKKVVCICPFDLSLEFFEKEEGDNK